MKRLHDRLHSARRGYQVEALALVAALGGTLVLAGWLLAGVLGVVASLAVAVITTRMLGALGTRGVMRLQRAMPLAPWQAPEIARSLALLAQRAGLVGPPRLYLLPGSVPNAFVVGSGDDTAVAVSKGLVTQLDRRELRGVLAHEVGHLQAGDTDVLRLSRALVQATRSVAQLGLLTCVASALLGSDVPLLVPLLFFGAPSAALALQLWLSRRREFAADAAAVALTDDAYGLASALCRLDRWRTRLRHLGYALGTPPSWLSTHPPTHERLARLQALQPEAFLPAPPRRTVWRWVF